MTLVEDIFGLLHKCSLSKEEEDEAFSLEEVKGAESILGKHSILGKLAIVQKFSKGALRDAIVTVWKIKENDIQFVEVSENIFQIIFSCPNVLTYALRFGP
ncbi:hypothetical protein Syun_021059 [Stephania yunnanensis]|uniref:Uncharacterized protein n=1 Tax=Stephania yunnanensis TaxID=152371 RepID=A0AAP0NNT7_9MAGN